MPATAQRKRNALPVLPTKTDTCTVAFGNRQVALTNLQKPFWPNYTKRDLLQYYIQISPWLLPHIQDRAMVMKRYPNGIKGAFFYMKRAPMPRPDWIRTCAIEHASGSVIDFPVVDDLASLLWIVNLGCIDLNPWYGRCPKTDQPDYLHFDLDPVDDTVPFERICEVALLIRETLNELKLPCYAKTTGSRGLHLYIPIVRGPTQKMVWAFAKAFAFHLASRHPLLITAQYRIEKRPKGRILVDYNQNAWGRTLASVYSVRPKPRAPVSAPVMWEEIAKGFKIDDFRIETMPTRIKRYGDLWAPVDATSARARLQKFL